MNARTPTLPQLRAFVAVADFLHFGAAAAELEVSQPGLSAALTGCEEALNVRLVERTTRRVMLTAAGRHLLPEARKLLDTVDSFVTGAERFTRIHSGIHRIGIIPTVAPYLLPALFRTMRRDVPHLEPRIHELRTADIATQLDAGTLDVGICAVPVAGNVTTHPLYTESLLLAVPKGSELGDGAECCPHDFVGEDMLLLEEGHCLRDHALEVCHPTGIRSESLSSASGIPTLLRLVEAGFGVALVPETATRHESKGTAVSFRRINAPNTHRQIVLLYRRGDERGEEHQALADLIRRAVRQRQLPVRILSDEDTPAGN